MTTNNQNQSSASGDARDRLVLDVGKTRSKLGLWSSAGRCLAQWSRNNAAVHGVEGLRVLDVEGIDAWLRERLREAAGLGDVGHFIAVAHGAAFARLRGGERWGAVLDYEQPWPAELLAAYRAQRDDFALTGSPALPDGLNLGAQLHALEAREPTAFAPGTTWLTWPQYWAWRLCGVAASEVTSLGCHTDLWAPVAGSVSPLARRRGWEACLAPLHGAGEVLGMLRPDWAAATGLPVDVKVYCGLHDSNAALLAARAALGDAASAGVTVLSTGTWFVALRSTPQPIDIARLEGQRDVLVNVDAFGSPTPSARFMGGREIELLRATDTPELDAPAAQAAQLAALDAVLQSAPAVLPGSVQGCGPFPGHRGGWAWRPDTPAARQAAIALYLALMADVLLDLVDSGEPLVIEGRFARCTLFVQSLAALRPGQSVFVATEGLDVALGALSLLPGGVAADASPDLQRVVPLAADIDQYRERWRAAVARAES
ncbi:MAG: hypothetical protein RL026_1578 [Pseudomonadota bacterium]